MEYPPSSSFMLLHLLAGIGLCAKKRNFSLWIEAAGILSAYIIFVVIVVVVVVVVIIVYAIHVYGVSFLLDYPIDWTPSLSCSCFYD
jgi:hypothetical protein